MKTPIMFYRWLPRMIAILAIAFISLFAGDAFDANQSIWQKITDFYIHLVPSFLLLVLLWIAWTRTLTGGILFTAVGVITLPFIFIHNYQVNHFSVAQCTGIVLIINFPFIVVGILFIVSYFKVKKQ